MVPSLYYGIIRLNLYAGLFEFYEIIDSDVSISEKNISNIIEI